MLLKAGIFFLSINTIIKYTLMEINIIDTLCFNSDSLGTKIQSQIKILPKYVSATT